MVSQTSGFKITNGVLLRAGLLSALFTGLLEVAIVYVKMLSGKPPHLGPHVLWMAPVGNLLWFLPITAALLTIRSFRHTRMPLYVALGILAAMTAFALLLYFPLYLVAKILLVCGIGIQVGRITRAREMKVLSIIRWLLPVTTGIVLVLAAAAFARQRFQERRWLAKLPAAPAGAPNVLLLVLDAVRVKSLSLYGYDRLTTPALSRWAHSATVFEQAFATAPWTLPSHGSMFTGHWAQELTADWEVALDDHFPTLAEELQDHGYLTAGFVGNLYYCGRDMGLARGFIHYEDFPISFGEVVVNTSLGRYLQSLDIVREVLGFHDLISRKNAEEVQNGFLDWLPSTANRPFFAFINYFDAHQPYLPPDEFERKFASNKTPRRHRYDRWERNIELRSPQKLSAAEIRRERDAYDASIAYMDQAIDNLLQTLKRRGILDNTIVIITSDHGEQFGEHGLFGHGNSLYTQLTQVPLVVRFPGRVPSNLRMVEPVSLRDIAATILALAGISQHDIPGRPFLPLGSDRSMPDFPRPLPIAYLRRGKSTAEAVVLDHNLFIRDFHSVENLFDLFQDPEENRNLLESEPHPEILEKARSALRIVRNPSSAGGTP